jgi:hypothetical protein
MSRIPAGGAVITSAIDFLQPEINRPDVFTERSVARGGILKGKPRNLSSDPATPGWVSIVSSLMLIVLSAFIFVTIVGWFTVIQSALDAHFINSIIEAQTTSRLYYAGIATVITLLVMLLFIWIYVQYLRPLSR